MFAYVSHDRWFGIELPSVMTKVQDVADLPPTVAAYFRRQSLPGKNHTLRSFDVAFREIGGPFSSNRDRSKFSLGCVSTLTVDLEMPSNTPLFVEAYPNEGEVSATATCLGVRINSPFDPSNPRPQGVARDLCVRRNVGVVVAVSGASLRWIFTEGWLCSGIPLRFQVVLDTANLTGGTLRARAVALDERRVVRKREQYITL